MEVNKIKEQQNLGQKSSVSTFDIVMAMFDYKYNCCIKLLNKETILASFTLEGREFQILEAIKAKEQSDAVAIRDGRDQSCGHWVVGVE